MARCVSCASLEAPRFGGHRFFRREASADREGSGDFGCGSVAPALGPGRPRLIILDEATSALDNPTQQIVTESLAEMSATRVVVAHRLSTVRDTDQIAVVDAGRIIEVGSHEVADGARRSLSGPRRVPALGARHERSHAGGPGARARPRTRSKAPRSCYAPGALPWQLDGAAVGDAVT